MKIRLRILNSCFISRSLVAAFAVLWGACGARAQLVGEPPLQHHHVKKSKDRSGDLEWLWQYGPPPPGGREHDLIQDPHFQGFLHQYFTAPQTFWGLQSGDPKDPRHKSLADTVYDFLTVPGVVIADDNRYITATGCVFHFCPSRGLIFADLNGVHPLVAFAAIEWIRQSHTTDQADAEYTLWIFPNQAPGTSEEPTNLPPPLVHSLVRWIKTPLAGSGIVQKVTAAILVDPDGTPHQIPVPTEGSR
jgi:hypothetical protein